eukprot:2674054-Prymnesium_polylepis.1
MSYAIGDGWRRRLPISTPLTFDLHARDKDGNPQSRPGYTPFLVTLTPRARGNKATLLRSSHHAEGGVSTYAFSLPREGSYVLSATLRGEHIQDSPFNLVGV